MRDSTAFWVSMIVWGVIFAGVIGIGEWAARRPCPIPAEPADPHFSPQSWNHSRIEIEFVELPMECPKGRNCL